MTQLMLSCLKATGLIEKKLNFSLGKREGLQLLLHKSMCQACTNYEKQSLLLDKSLKQQVRYLGEWQPKELRLSDDFKKKLLKKLEIK